MAGRKRYSLRKIEEEKEKKERLAIKKILAEKEKGKSGRTLIKEKLENLILQLLYCAEEEDAQLEMLATRSTIARLAIDYLKLSTEEDEGSSFFNLQEFDKPFSIEDLQQNLFELNEEEGEREEEEEEKGGENE